MTKIAKGTLCYLFSNWNRLGVVTYRRVTVQSWGKKQGTASHTENGRMIESRLYVAHDAERLIPVADCADPHAEALRRSVLAIAHERAHFERIMAGNQYGNAYADSKASSRPGQAAYAKAIDADHARICAAQPDAFDLDDPQAFEARMAAYRAANPLK